MSVVSAFVLLAVTWFLTMFVVLPIRLRTQGDEDDIVEGTHAGAPANFRLGRTMLIVTLVSLALWGLQVWIITSGLITVSDFDWFGRMEGM